MFKTLVSFVLVAGSAMFLPGCCPFADQTESQRLNDSAQKRPQQRTMETEEFEVIYPCEGCGVLKIKKEMPEEVQLGREFTYYITAENLTDRQLADVVITEYMNNDFEFVRSDPKPQTVEGNLIEWRLASIKPQGSRRISVVGTAGSVGDLRQCATATYKMPACATTTVVEAKLALNKTAPEMVVICDNIPLQYTVRNTGTGTTTEVVINDQLPQGMSLVGGGNTVNIPVGILKPGESKDFTVMTVADQTGQFSSKAVARAAGDMRAESSETAVEVIEPVLAIEKTGRDSVYVDRNLTYDITVSNEGNAPTTGLVVEDMIPAGAEFSNASMGGQREGNMVVWRLGSLAPGASEQLQVTYVPAVKGETRNTVRASAECAQAVESSVVTAVEGIAAVLLEVVDIHDPIEVGQNETYEITVTNQGSAQATNVAITAELDQGMEYVRGSGPTAVSVSGNKVTFASLPSIAPKDEVTWKVVVKALEPGGKRVLVTMDCDQIDPAVAETESTHFYE